MTIFVTIPLTPASRPLLDAAVAAKIPTGDSYKLQSDMGWLISFSGTTIDLSNLLELTGQPKGEASKIGSALVVPVGGSYYGRGPTDMWEWLKTKLEA